MDKNTPESTYERIKNICTCTANLMASQLNCFTGDYAVKYPDCPFASECDKSSPNSIIKCPYELIDNEKSLNDADKVKLINFYDALHITPCYIDQAAIDDDMKIKLLHEVLDEYRSVFHREEERIIFTKELRRLQYKTQVMINSASDDQRTRLLHSLEVQKISRKIAIALKANYELVETIAIAHDIGHTPFGHAGESAIKRFLENQLVGSFSHALQIVKVIDFLCKHSAMGQYGLKGLGVSDYVLEGVLKHDTDSFIDNLAGASFRLQYECPNLYKPVGISSKDQEDKVFIGSVESQIVCWADKIAYMSHDWEEFVSVGLLEIMLTRINSMIILIDDYIHTDDKKKYNYVSNIEKEQLYSIESAIQKLKNYFLSDEYTQEVFDIENDEFVKGLYCLIQILETTVRTQSDHESSFLFFSKEQYKLLLSFFKIAWAWIYITKTKPQKISGKLDLIFLISEYLRAITSRKTAPALIQMLINDSVTNLTAKGSSLQFTREELIDNCNNKLSNHRDTNTGLDFKDIVAEKQNIKEAFAVHLIGTNATAANYISSFIYDEYILSTRVQFMTEKAGLVINKLMKFYYDHPQMLPLEQRKRMEFEASMESIRTRTKELLCQYYIDRIHQTFLRDNKNKYLCMLLKPKKHVREKQGKTRQDSCHSGQAGFRNKAYHI